MSPVPAVQEFEVGREFVLKSCVNVPEGLVGRTRGESPSDDSSGILHATDPPQFLLHAAARARACGHDGARSLLGASGPPAPLLAAHLTDPFSRYSTPAAVWVYITS